MAARETSVVEAFVNRPATNGAFVALVRNNPLGDGNGSNRIPTVWPGVGKY